MRYSGNTYLYYVWFICYSLNILRNLCCIKSAAQITLYNIKLINKIKNLFIVYGYAGPDYFCDRKEDTDKLISALKNRRHVTLMSPRRMGKTGLIKNAFHYIHRQKPEAACFYMDIFSNYLPERFHYASRTNCDWKTGYTFTKSIEFLGKFL